MKRLLKSSFSFRLFSFHLLLVFTTAWCFRFFLIFQMRPFEPTGFLRAAAISIPFDLTVVCYSFFPVWIISLLSLRGLTLAGVRRFYFWFITVELLVLLVLTGAEFFFFQEFRDRFNFIAVDYLVYSNEVIRNIWESYPIVWILTGITALTAAIAYPLSKALASKFSHFERKNILKSKFSYFYVGLIFLSFVLINEQRILSGSGPYEEVIGKNGLHALFAAYRNNEINYDRFYPGMSLETAQKRVKELIGTKDEIRFDQNGGIHHSVRSAFPGKKCNVVLVLMESMSARFMKSYGNDKVITPNLDRLAKEGLFFQRLYSTGTRTVRGIEAVVLSMPPTPGQSIVRRPGGQGLVNLGSIFNEHGYKSEFIYGGYGVFDNMNGFFQGNGFEPHDQYTFPKEEIHFKNAWGVSDEDLFQQALKRADLAYADKKPFFQFILTVSNHRPYTYPEGAIDLPSGKSGRDGAVKYSDYAIGKFMEQAKSKAWYENTLFLFVADHNASVAGGSKILPEDFRIPMIFYQPKIVSPKVNANLGSQIDLAPTLFGLLNFQYDSKFFGVDLLKENPNRTFLGTYVKVALMENERLTVLSPGFLVDSFSLKDGYPYIEKKERMSQVDSAANQEILNTVAYYKLASDQFSRGLLKAVVKE